MGIDMEREKRYIFYTFSGQSCSGMIFMRFEFDDAKSDSNYDKHGIDFIAAQALWFDENMLEIPARTNDEPRWLVVGMIGKKTWSAVITRRRGAIRIISVRRARDEEIALYEATDENNYC